MPPQRTIATRRPKLENLRRVIGVNHLAASNPKFIQRKHDLRGSRSRKTNRRGRFLLHRGINKTPPPHLAPNESLSLQNIESSRNGRPIQPNGLSQFPSRRNPLPARHAPSKDRRTQLFMELAIERRGRLGIEFKVRKHTNFRLTIPYWMAPGSVFR